jgi:hypothetical protein
VIRVGDTSSASAARFLRTYKPPPRRDWRKADTDYLDELLVMHAGGFIGRRATDIYADVRADYGTVGERRLWSRLGGLVRRGLLERVEGGYRRPRRRS